MSAKLTWNTGCMVQVKMGPCAMECQPSMWARCPKWCVQHTSTRAQAKPRSHRLRLSSACFLSPAAAASLARVASLLRGLLGKPCQHR